MAKFMIHNNNHLMCAVDVETTGLNPKKHDIIQICVLPLDSFFEPLKDVTPFYIDMKPTRIENIEPDAMRTNKSRLANLVINGIDSDQAADLFYAWVEKLNLGLNKKIAPLAHNWPFDRSFLIEWLGLPMFEETFYHVYRDTLAAAIYANDRSDLNNEKVQYSQYKLVKLATALQIEFEECRAHDAMADCLATARVYKSMIRQLH